MDEIKRVSVNLVTGNHMSFLEACLSSLQDQDAPYATVTIVDNASDDGTLRYVERNHSEVTVLRNFRPLGTTRALNQATAFALSRFPEDLWPHRYVFFTVPEAECASDAIRLLIEALETDPSIAAVAPSVLQAHVRVSEVDEDRETERTETLAAAGLFLTRSRTRRLGSAGEPASTLAGTRPVFGAPGMALMIRASVLASLKDRGEWFDEAFEGGYEDVDFAWRMVRAGARTACVPEARVWYRHSTSATKTSGMRFRERIREQRNRICMIWKNDNIGSMLRYSPWILASVLFSVSGLLGSLWALGRFPQTWMKRRRHRDVPKIDSVLARGWFI